MKCLLLTAFLAVASAAVVKEDNYVVIGKDPLVNLNIKSKEILCMKLLNYILQPTIYDDVREVARDWVVEDKVDKYMKVEVVKRFVEVWKMGMLPRGEVFVHSNEKHMDQAIVVFRLMYFAKDFDTFMRTACFLRERINSGMFVYAFTVAVFHREDCRGIILPAPYEIYPHFFVDSHVINKAFMLKTSKAATDPALYDYYGIRVTEKNLVFIDWRKGVRHLLSEDDRLNYFTEDIDLNTFYYYLNMNYPYWMTDDEYDINKERRGEIYMFSYRQLLARYRLERLSQKMCDVTMVNFNNPLQNGYWPKIRLHTGDEMPVRSNNVQVVNQYNIKEKKYIDDIERVIRDSIIKGRFERRDGTVVNLKKTEDFENLARMILSGMGYKNDDGKVVHLMHLFRKLMAYGTYNVDKYTYVPTALDMYTTCLRDPLFWRIMKRITENAVIFHKFLPKYTKDEIDFPGVKIEHVTTDTLETFMDDYDVDITNALYLDETEIQKKKSDMTFIARSRRLNHHPFKVSVDVVSEKAVDAVVRIFIGPKYDCMGRLISVNDKRFDMLLIDSFLYKLETGKNTIIRNSKEMQDVINDRPWTRHLKDTSMSEGIDTVVGKDEMASNYWYKHRLGIPHGLLLPLGWKGGLPLQMYVIITPVRDGMVSPNIDIKISKDRHTCYFSACIDTMPLGFPFDREIDVTRFYTSNMKFVDILVLRKDFATSNTVKEVDTSDMIMKHDDYTYLDTDMLVRWSYKDVMMMSADKMTRH